MTNRELATKLKTLEDLLIIGGSEETHAARFGRLAYTISRLPEEVSVLSEEGRLCEIPGVGPNTAALISEYLLTGTCRKRREWERRIPASVLELLSIPGLGAKSVRHLYRECGIRDMESLERALHAGDSTLLRRMDARTATILRRYLAHRPPTGRSLNTGLFAELEEPLAA